MRLRTCPLCRSKAVSALERFDADDGLARVEVLCGACRTWRGGAIGRRAADALERRLRNDRRKMELSIGQGERWREHELVELVQRGRTHR